MKCVMAMKSPRFWRFIAAYGDDAGLGPGGHLSFYVLVQVPCKSASGYVRSYDPT